MKPLITHRYFTSPCGCPVKNSCITLRPLSLRDMCVQCTVQYNVHHFECRRNAYTLQCTCTYSTVHGPCKSQVHHNETRHKKGASSYRLLSIRGTIVYHLIDTRHSDLGDTRHSQEHPLVDRGTFPCRHQSTPGSTLYSIDYVTHTVKTGHFSISFPQTVPLQITDLLNKY